MSCIGVIFSILFDEIEKEEFNKYLNNDKNEFKELKNYTKNSNNITQKSEIINHNNDYPYIIEYNIIFYNETSIHNFLKDKSSLLKNDNIFEYENNPIILGTSFILHLHKFT